MRDAPPPMERSRPPRRPSAACPAALFCRLVPARPVGILGFLGSLRAAPDPAPRRVMRRYPHSLDHAWHERLAGAALEYRHFHCSCG